MSLAASQRSMSRFGPKLLITLALFGMPALAAFPSVPGIENFYRVDDQVYRGAQPTDEGFKYLSKIGVKVVLDLRQHKEASEERLVTAAGMRYVSVPMTGLTPPTQAETNAVLALLEDQAAGPVFVHCKRGADRTGAVIAAYRIDQEKWDNARALREAMADGMSPRQVPRKKFIRTFQSRNTAPAAGAEDASVTHI